MPVTVAASAPGSIVRAGGSSTSPNWANVQTLYTVPKGKRLVIKYLAAGGNIGNGKLPLSLDVDAYAKGLFTYYIPVFDQGQLFNRSYFKGSEQVMIVAEAGERVSWTCSPSDGNQNGSCEIEMVGTLVDTP